MGDPLGRNTFFRLFVLMASQHIFLASIATRGTISVRVRILMGCLWDTQLSQVVGKK